MVDRAHPVGERGDGCVIGDVEGLSGDAEPLVGVGELGPVAACRDHMRALVARQ